MRAQQVVIGSLVFWPWVWARSSIVPANVKDFYNGLVRNKTCTNKLATGFYSTGRGKNTFSYCGDHLSDYNVVYIQGNNGLLADMDVDCDGAIQRSPENDRRCDSSPDRSSGTAFRELIQGYRKGIRDLDPYIHSYVVLGNDGSKHGGITFDPTEHGIDPLSLVAVVCNDKLVCVPPSLPMLRVLENCSHIRLLNFHAKQFYGVWGDEYGGRKPMVGESSLSLATACFGRGMNGNNGHETNDVLYIAFPGKNAVPGADGAAWSARTWVDFHESIATLGDRLIQRIPGASNWSRPALQKKRAEN
ncbi:fungal chitosanase [Seiridium cupressi]